MTKTPRIFGNGIQTIDTDQLVVRCITNDDLVVLYTAIFRDYKILLNFWENAMSFAWKIMRDNRATIPVRAGNVLEWMYDQVVALRNLMTQRGLFSKGVGE